MGDDVQKTSAEKARIAGWWGALPLRSRVMLALAAGLLTAALGTLCSRLASTGSRGP